MREVMFTTRFIDPHYPDNFKLNVFRSLIPSRSTFLVILRASHGPIDGFIFLGVRCEILTAGVHSSSHIKAENKLIKSTMGPTIRAYFASYFICWRGVVKSFRALPVQC